MDCNITANGEDCFPSFPIQWQTYFAAVKLILLVVKLLLYDIESSYILFKYNMTVLCSVVLFYYDADLHLN